MKGLLVKDLELSLQQKKFFLVLLVLGVLLTFSTDGTFAAGYFTFVCAMFVTSTISYDEYENGFPFLLTLPASRSEYVKEKYLFALGLVGAAWLTGLAVELLCCLFDVSAVRLDEVVGVSLVMLAVALVVDAVMIPFLLKYGQEKGRYISLGVLGAVTAAGYFAGRLLGNGGIDLLKVLEKLENADSWLMTGVLLAGTVLVYVVSYGISRVIMNKKEF